MSAACGDVCKLQDQDTQTATAAAGPKQPPAVQDAAPRHVCKQWTEAAKTGDVTELRRLLRAHNSLLNQQAGGLQCTAAHWAAANGHADALQQLLQWGADVTTLKTATGCLPLHSAAAAGQQECVQLLLATDPALQQHQLAAENEDGLTAAALALRHGHKVVQGMLLQLATAAPQHERLPGSGQQQQQQQGHQQQQQATSQPGMKRGFLLGGGGRSSTTSSASSSTAAPPAAMDASRPPSTAGHVDMGPGAAQGAGHPPATPAEAAEMSTASVSAQPRPEEAGYTEPALTAGQQQDQESETKKIAVGGCVVPCPDSAADTMTHDREAAAAAVDAACAAATDCPPVMHTADTQDVEQPACAAEAPAPTPAAAAPADVPTPTADAATPAPAAAPAVGAGTATASAAETAAARVVDRVVGRAWLDAARAGDLARLQQLLLQEPRLLGYSGTGTSYAFVGNSALHWAAAKGHRGLVVWLLQQGASVAAVNQAGATALHTAVEHGQWACAEVLVLRGGADVHVADGYGQSAVGMAAAAEQTAGGSSGRRGSKSVGCGMAERLLLWETAQKLQQQDRASWSNSNMQRLLQLAGRRAEASRCLEKAELVDLAAGVLQSLLSSSC